MKNNKLFKGIITPLVTPFYSGSEEINYDAATDLIEHLISKQVSGIFILGSNGEFHSLTNDEKIKFTKHVVSIVDSRVPVYAGAGSCSTKITLELGQKMIDAGVDALSLITPYFIPNSEEELFDYYNTIAKKLEIPIVLYNIPKFTGVSISRDLLIRLSNIDNIQAIKDSSGSEELLEDYLMVSQDFDIKVLVGSDSKISFAQKLGATGAIAGTSNVITDIVVELWNLLEKKDFEKANVKQEEIEAIRAVLKLGTVPSILKRSISLANISNVGPARKPLLHNKSNDDEINAVLDYYFK